MVAREFHHEAIFTLLMERSPAALKLALACEMGDETAFRSLLANNPGLAKTLSDDERGKIVGAAEGNNTQAVRMMLEAGWPVDARAGGMGATALHFAAWHANIEMMKEILRYHPPLEVADASYNNTPLQWALHGSKNSWERHNGDYGVAVEMLLQAGAKAPGLTEDLEASEAALAALRR
jgi:ankyrin repeat protein